MNRRLLFKELPLKNGRNRITFKCLGILDDSNQTKTTFFIYFASSNASRYEHST